MRMMEPKEVPRLLDKKTANFAPFTALTASENSRYAGFQTGRVAKELQHLKSIGITGQIANMAVRLAHDRSLYCSDIPDNRKFDRGVEGVATNKVDPNRFDAFTVYDIDLVLRAMDSSTTENTWVYNKPSRHVAVYLLLRTSVVTPEYIGDIQQNIDSQALKV